MARDGTEGVKRVLLVKTSSLGDVIHLLPAVTEAKAVRPELCIDWLVEEAFAEVPAWHRGVSRVIPVGFRRWRGRRLAMLRSPEWATLRAELRGHRYDRVIDAQGLIKSVFLAWQARGRRSGFAAGSAREPLASVGYRQRIRVAKGLHAVERLRRLLAAALGYVVGESPPDYGLGERLATVPLAERRDSLLLLHGTTWANKAWPEPHWAELGRRAVAAGVGVELPWGTESERLRAERIAEGCGGEVLPRASLTDLLERMARSRAVVGVDSGLVHLAAAADVPGVALFGPTDPALTGPWGGRLQRLAADLGCAPCGRRACRSAEPVRMAGGTALEPPCLASLTPDRVWQALAPRLVGERAA